MKQILFFFALVISTITSTMTFAEDSTFMKLVKNVSPITYKNDGKVDYIFSSLLLTYDVANITDLILTKKILKIDDGGMMELNPLIKFGYEKTPLDWIIKITAMSVVHKGSKWLYKNKHKTAAYVTVISMAGLYSWMTYRNYKITLKINI